MAGKSKIRSIRFSDTMMEMIESQAGETFTAKFEALVTRCIWELPRKEEELKGIQERIDSERKNLQYIQRTKRQLEQQISSMNYALSSFNAQLKRCTEALERIET